MKDLENLEIYTENTLCGEGKTAIGMEDSKPVAALDVEKPGYCTVYRILRELLSEEIQTVEDLPRFIEHFENFECPKGKEGCCFRFFGRSLRKYIYPEHERQAETGFSRSEIASPINQYELANCARDVSAAIKPETQNQYAGAVF